jgi:hypothetical protein
MKRTDLQKTTQGEYQHSMKHHKRNEQTKKKQRNRSVIEEAYEENISTKKEQRMEAGADYRRFKKKETRRGQHTRCQLAEKCTALSYYHL